jgi:hypothetical protein
MDLDSAQIANGWFLAVVATWRVGLYLNFLVKVAKLSVFRILVATLLPLTAIIVSLATLNLEHVVFEFMSGIRPEERSPNDKAYLFIWLLSIFAYVTFPISLCLYLIAVFKNPGNRNDA